MNRKGLSNIIATVLIVLLALAAVAIVWSVFSNILGESSSEAVLRNLCIQSEAKPTSCVYTNDKVNVSVQLTRGDSVEKIIGVVTLDDGTTISGEVPNPEVLETKTISINRGDNPQDVVSARAAVVVKDEDGNTKTCDVSPTEVQCTSA